jgi:hypothetical protein
MRTGDEDYELRVLRNRALVKTVGPNQGALRAKSPQSGGLATATKDGVSVHVGAQVDSMNKSGLEMKRP